MLLIDPSRNAISQSVASMRAPFVHERAGHDPIAAKSLISRLRPGPNLMRALLSELRTHAGSSPNGPAQARNVTQDAVRAIVSGAIKVGRLLPPHIELMLLPTSSAQPLGLGAVIFPTEKAAKNFTASLTDDSAAMGTIQQALAHRASGSAGGLSLDNGDDPASRFAELLSTQQLALVPMDPSLRRLRLVWVKRAPPADNTDAAPPPPPPPAPAPPARANAPASVLPAPPAQISPQAQAMIDAAKLGIPFCQECFQRAMQFG